MTTVNDLTIDEKRSLCQSFFYKKISCMHTCFSKYFEDPTFTMCSTCAVCYDEFNTLVVTQKNVI